MIARHTYQSLTWVDLTSPTDAEIQQIAHEFDVSPDIAEEIFAPSPKPRVELFKNFIFLILHFPAIKHSHGIEKRQEVDFIIGKDFLITTRYDTIDAIDKFSKVFEVNAILEKTVIGDHAGFLMYFLLRKLYKSLLHELEYMESILDNIERRIFEEREKEMVVDLSRVSRELIDFKKTISYHGEILSSLETAGKMFFGNDFGYYLHGITSDYRRVQDLLEGQREVLDELRDTNHALLSSKQSEVMKTFTILAFVTFPLTLVVQILQYSPIVRAENAFLYIAGTIVVLMVLMVIYFRHKRWL